MKSANVQELWTDSTDAVSVTVMGLGDSFRGLTRKASLSKQN